MTGMHPLRDRIFVKQDPVRDDITSAGLIVAARSGIHTSKEQLGLKGTVVAVGPEVDQDQLKPGDRILFGEFEYARYERNGEKLLVMQDKDVCGVIDG